MEKQGRAFPPQPVTSRRTSKLHTLKTAFLGVCVAYTLFNVRDLVTSTADGAGIALSAVGSLTQLPAHLCGHHRAPLDSAAVPWQPCGEISSHPLECANLTVPLDHFNEANSANRTFTIPLIRLRGKESSPGRNILLNPGGPGGSGINFMYRKGALLNTIVGETFDLVSFDPRGINGSRPQALCYPDEDTRRDLSPNGVRTGLADVERDSGYAFSRADNFAQACRDTTGEEGAYINTPQTAADMNSILDALGQEELYYWGFSYGTILGQTYATMFPERVGRVVIDGVANLFDWYDSLLDEEMWTDTDHVLEGFITECVKAGQNCSLTSVAETEDELREVILDLGFELKEQPIGVYINASQHGLVDYETVFLEAFFTALYKPEGWHRLADTLAQMVQGNATQALLDYVLGGGVSVDGDANAFVTLNDGLTGAKYWPQGREEILRDTLPLYNASLFAVTEGDTFYEKALWRLPNTHGFKAKKSVKTAHPLLVLSTTFDPVCPLKSARVARDIFEDSRLVEVKGYGHCSVAMPSKCLAGHVKAYFTSGKMPPGEGDVQCEVDVPYFLPPESKAAHVEIAVVDDEERRLLEAQMELARADGWPW